MLRAHGAADLALLRDLRRAGGPRAAARQLPGGPAAGRRAPDLADQHRPLSALDGRGARLRLDRPARHRRAARGDARHAATRWSGSAGTSTTGTTPATLRPLEPPYVSTVDSGNLAGHLLALAQACRELVGPPAARPSALDGHRRRARLRARGRRGDLADDRRTQTVTPPAARRRRRRPSRPRSARRRRRPRDWARGCATLDDAGRHPGRRRAHAATPSAATPRRRAGRLGARRSRAAVASHARDLDTLLPWARARGRAHGDRAARRAPAPAMAERCRRRSRSCAGALGPAPSRRSRDASSGRRTPAARSSAGCSRSRRRARRLFDEMEFGFLFDPTRKLLSIGYRVREGELDPNCYDLLASEARLASFVAIAKGDVPASHWFRLGRADDARRRAARRSSRGRARCSST